MGCGWSPWTKKRKHENGSRWNKKKYTIQEEKIGWFFAGIKVKKFVGLKTIKRRRNEI